MPNLYTIFYGWLSDGPDGEPNRDARRIAAARMPLLIASFWTEPRTHRSLSPQVLTLMRESGTRVFAYVSTRWGRAELQAVKSAVSEYLEAGADGVFLDEGHNFLDSSKLLYYRSIAQLARSGGGEVIVNPGVARCGADVMSIADYVMLEHAWRELRTTSPWCAGHAPSRFMGVSSNEPGAMPYAIARDRAIADTREAWACGVGWHTSTERFTRLPAWYEDYAAALKP